ncbi:MAG: hypothetical protein EBR02_09210 [Alphaproteobacteria bacterium]|nr:hypothetical protein [Alphaproteobacteria bacterium]
MKKIILLSTVAAFSFAAAASAATLTNTDKTDAKFIANIGGEEETVTLKENASYDSKGKDVGFIFGTEKPVLAKGEEHFVIKGGKIEMEPAKTSSTETKQELKVGGVAIQTKDGAPVTLSSAPAKLEPAAKAATAPAAK